MIFNTKNNLNEIKKQKKYIFEEKN